LVVVEEGMDYDLGMGKMYTRKAHMGLVGYHLEFSMQRTAVASEVDYRDEVAACVSTYGRDGVAEG
jgi:hypothetical protein